MNMEEEKNRLTSLFNKDLINLHPGLKERDMANLIKEYVDDRFDLLERDLNAKIQVLKRDSLAPHTKR